MIPPHGPPPAEEPEYTMYVPAWSEARNHLVRMEPGATRALLARAMDLVEDGWPPVRALQRWAEQEQPERDRSADDYSILLTFAEVDVRETFRSLVSSLADLVIRWPGGEGATANDVDGWLSGFCNHTSVLLLATKAAGAGVPGGFRTLVDQAARLRAGGDWSDGLRAVLEDVGDRSEAETSASDVWSALEALVYQLPEAARPGVGGLILRDVAQAFAAAGQEPPAWLTVLSRR